MNKLSKLILKQEIHPGSNITLDVFEEGMFVFRPTSAVLKAEDIVDLDGIVKG